MIVLVLVVLVRTSNKLHHSSSTITQQENILEKELIAHMVWQVKRQETLG